MEFVDCALESILSLAHAQKTRNNIMLDDY